MIAPGIEEGCPGLLGALLGKAKYAREFRNRARDRAMDRGRRLENSRSRSRRRAEECGVIAPFPPKVGEVAHHVEHAFRVGKQRYDNRAAEKRPPAGEQLEQNRARREDIGPYV